MPAIVLATINARWIHSAFGLRCLRANLGALRADSKILEFESRVRPADVAEAILAEQPIIVGLSVYVWNATAMRELVSILSRVRPDVTIVLGGPEVSHETELQPVCSEADYVVRGEGDLAFAELCRRVLSGERPEPRWIDAPPPSFDQLAWPYDEYDARDLAHRVVYVEASRGCPFTCEFCLSALDVPVRKAPLEGFLDQMQQLLDRGLQHFKFVDRTFNLDVRAAKAILEFFRQRHRPGLFLHFEMIPDRLPAALRDTIAAFPDGALQFEVGVQTLEPDVSRAISRRQDDARLEDNLRWLRNETGVHVHADLIAGLPGEDLAMFGKGFDRLVGLRPQEIQVGILKRLRGTPIVRHARDGAIVWSDTPPYEVLKTRSMSFEDLQRIKRFARFWDIVANSGRWPATLRLLLTGESPFERFLAFSDWLSGRLGATHGIAMPRLAAAMFDWLTGPQGLDPGTAGPALCADYERGHRHDWPEFLRPWAKPRRAPSKRRGEPRVTATARQARHRND
jgi:tRNA A37 methylthiotransferase MiaB